VGTKRCPAPGRIKTLNFILVQVILYRNVATLNFRIALFYAGRGSGSALFFGNWIRINVKIQEMYSNRSKASHGGL
jgi:hypothetical protein